MQGKEFRVWCRDGEARGHLGELSSSAWELSTELGEQVWVDLAATGKAVERRR